MPEIYVAKNDLMDFFDLSCSVVLAESHLNLTSAAESYNNWRCFTIASASNGDLRIGRDPQDGSQAWESITYLGPNVIAIAVALSSELSNRLQTNEFAPVILPPVIVAVDENNAMAGVVSLLLQDAQKCGKALIAANSALVAARHEVETTQEAMAAALRTLGGQVPGAARIAYSSLPADDGPTFKLSAAWGILGQTLTIPVEGLTSVGLHFAESRCSDKSWIKIRIRGADLRIVYGSWLVPGDMIDPGWLTLDLRSVIGPIFETAVLEIETSLEADDTASLSLDPMECENYIALEGDPSLSGDHGACIRLFRSDYGSRNILPRFWNWDEIGTSAKLDTPQNISPEIWNRAQVIYGQISFISVGSEPARPVASINPQKPAKLRVPDIFFANSNVIEFVFSVLPVSTAPIRVQTCIEEVTADGQHRRTWTSGWKLLPQNCDRSTVSMRMPDCGPRINVVASLEVDEGAPQVTVEWSSIAGLDLADDEIDQHSQLQAGDNFLATLEDAVVPALPPSRPAPVFSGIQIDHVLVINDADYSHIDLQIFDLSVGVKTVPALRLKLIKRLDTTYIEFRSRPDWPSVFEQWPVDKKDQYGPLYNLNATPENLANFRALTTENDFKLLLALLKSLPRIIQAALTDPKAANQDAQSWKSSIKYFLGKLDAEKQPYLDDTSPGTSVFV